MHDSPLRSPSSPWIHPNQVFYEAVDLRLLDAFQMHNVKQLFIRAQVLYYLFNTFFGAIEGISFRQEFQANVILDYGIPDMISKRMIPTDHMSAEVSTIILFLPLT